jgi:hypothetical protein
LFDLHAVLTTARYRRNGFEKLRLQKLFRYRADAEAFAAKWVCKKYGKYEDDVKDGDWNVRGEGVYTSDDWNEKTGMAFGACIEMRSLE